MTPGTFVRVPYCGGSQVAYVVGRRPRRPKVLVLRAWRQSRKCWNREVTYVHESLVIESAVPLAALPAGMTWPANDARAGKPIMGENQ